MYAKLEDNKIIYAPINFTNKNNQTIVNFNKSIELMKQYGFKEVIENKLSYDELTEYLNIGNYEETEENIIINYIINSIQQQEPTEIEILRQDLEMTQNALNDLLMNLV